MLIENAITPELFCRFHNLANFRRYDLQDVVRALQGTLFSVVAFHNKEPVGIARVIGDGRLAFIIKDVIVHPDFRGCHYGQEMMERLLEYINESGCLGAYIGLMATPGMESFYEKFGFVRRPNDKHGAGMIQYLGEGSD